MVISIPQNWPHLKEIVFHFWIDLITIFHLKKFFEKSDSNQSYKQKKFLCINYL